LNKDIKLEEWEGFFRRQLDEVKSKVIKEMKRRRRTGGEGNLGERRNKYNRIIRRLKDGKVIEMDGVSSEVEM